MSGCVASQRHACLSSLMQRLIPYNYSVFGTFSAYITLWQVKYVIASENFYTNADENIRAT